MQIFHNPNYNFIRWRWHAIALSAAIIIGGAVMIFTQGVPLGIDFSGGTLVRVQFEQQIRSARRSTRSQATRWCSSSGPSPTARS